MYEDTLSRADDLYDRFTDLHNEYSAAHSTAADFESENSVNGSDEFIA